MEEQDVDEHADAEGLTDAHRSAIREMAFHGTMLMLCMELHAPDAARRLFAAQGTCAGGTGVPPAPIRHRS